MISIKSEADITKIILEDEWMMDVLRAAEELGLPDWWIGAGFLRNKVWNHIEGNDSERTRDVDLVYFDKGDISETTDWGYDDMMNRDHPIASWEVRNQARMHYKNGFQPFSSTAGGIAHWTETATAVAVRLKNGNLEYLFCYGTDDLFNLVVRPTPYSKTEKLMKLFWKRVEGKHWKEKWPNLKVIPD